LPLSPKRTSQPHEKTEITAVLTQFGFKHQKKDIAGIGEFSKYNTFCVYRVPVFIPPIDQKIVYSEKGTFKSQILVSGD